MNNYFTSLSLFRVIKEEYELQAVETINKNWTFVPLLFLATKIAPSTLDQHKNGRLNEDYVKAGTDLRAAAVMQHETRIRTQKCVMVATLTLHYNIHAYTHDWHK